MFPGGRGRLTLVEPQKPARVLGGAEAPRPRVERRPARRREFQAAERGGGGSRRARTSAAAASGVEIEVTPAGKATRRLSLLSGGEKSLVALAFVFSVFLARPSPFYILDEVEAALDDANIDRFLQLVRRFSDRAQFVIVTHQKRTMDAADVLYGVSMQDGATKVISRGCRGRRSSSSASSDESGRSRRRARLRRPSWPTTWAELLDLGDREVAAVRRCRLAAGERGERARLLPAPAREPRDAAARRSAPSSAPSLFETVDAETWERLEEALIMADVGARTTAEVVGRLEGEVEAGPGRGGRGDPRPPRRAARRPRRERPHDDRPAAAEPGGRPDRRRQRHRQDDHGRQARLAPAEGGRASR